jgi:NADPH2:quinone reductase
MREATRLAEAGKLQVLLDAHRFGLDTVGEAYALIEQRQARGKVVIDIGG